MLLTKDHFALVLTWLAGRIFAVKQAALGGEADDTFRPLRLHFIFDV